MIKLTLTTSLPLAIALLCASPSRVEASGDTKVVVGDGGSLLLRADGLDAGKTWNVRTSELRHTDPNGVLSGLRITDGGADQCAGKPACGIDTAKPWSIRLIYNERSVTVSSVRANKGVHVKFSPKIHFDEWKKTANADEREYGHGDGKHITRIKVTGSDASLCTGKGGCQITLIYTTP
jgi:hypothetical protein